MHPWERYLIENRERFTAELQELLRIPSISSLATHADDVRRAGEWVAARMRRAGIPVVELIETGGHPVVYGETRQVQGRPTILIYGHFDVQPVDPLELWTTPPFDPIIRDGRLYARGASDDKGNMLVPILAIEALLRAEGALPLNVKLLFEGQEEIGSPQLPDFVVAHRERLACDMVISADSGQWSETEPALLTSLRGLCALQIDARGASSDLHSGIYGGAVQNPIHALVQLLASMRAPDGSITIDGFYDDVQPLTPEARERIAAVPFDEAAYQAQLGVTALFGEAGYSPHERIWARPTLEINGIWGGFQGEGTKTVLPNEAHAKITCRLVADQDPDRVAEAVCEHVRRNPPVGVEVTCRVLSGSARPYRIPDDHPGNAAAAEVLAELYGRAPYYVGVGGSVPVCELFQNILGVYTVGFGFALDDERFHAPDEFYRLQSFYRGQEGYCRLLQRLGRG
ncbi:MAG: peptidase dimerization domain protein [Armatimonadetes bacterium]|nr:peptidase dimerization domain protein [Armatimonadota bacterium]